MSEEPTPSAAAEVPSFETIPLTAGDGRALNLKHLTPAPTPGRGPVLMVAGTGTRANLFNPPTTKTLPMMLHARDWRR